MNTVLNNEINRDLIEFVKKHIPTIEHFTNSFVERRIPFVCSKLNIFSIEDFKQKMEFSSHFIDIFLSNFIVPPTEMFRDKNVWSILYKTILPKLLLNEQCNIWLPDCSTGEELFSLCILLQELDAQKNITIYASSRSFHSIEIIKKGVYSIKQENLFDSNFSCLELGSSFDKYYIKSHNAIYMNASLLQSVEFIHSPSILVNIPPNIHLVIFRNSLLYYTKQMHHIIYSLLHKNMEFDGYLILGLQEGYSLYEMDRLFKTVNKEERIYKKDLKYIHWSQNQQI